MSQSTKLSIYIPLKTLLYFLMVPLALFVKNLTNVGTKFMLVEEISDPGGQLVINVK